MKNNIHAYTCQFSVLDFETLRELNDFELRLLRDFVRGRGRGDHFVVVRFYS